MTFPAWLGAAALTLSTGLAAQAQTPTAQPAPPSQEARPAQSAPPRSVAGAPKQPSAGQKPPRSAPPTPPRAKPNTSYAHCRGVARYMGLRGAERRKTILDCQLGVMPKISKG